MPWDSTYKNAWQTFLTALAKQYGSQPELVSIAVAGPTASSEEMILPATRNTTGPQIGGLTPEEMWNDLLANHYNSIAYKDSTKYQQSDLAFILEWEHAIDMYGKTFSGITLTMSTGDGLPNLDVPNCVIGSGVTCTFTLPVDPTVDFSTVCPKADMDCAAETTILSYFRQSTVGGSNAKATQTDGMKGAGTAGNLGVPSVKLISQRTDTFTTPSTRILGGAQFAKEFSKPMQTVDEGGCSATCSPEQALNNVLTWFFSGTQAGSSFSGNSLSNGLAPLNYVQIYGPDISYATMAFTAGKVSVTKTDGATFMTTAQNQLSLASLALVLIAEY